MRSQYMRLLAFRADGAFFSLFRFVQHQRVFFLSSDLPLSANQVIRRFFLARKALYV
jgi:hypothetical protein